MRLWAKTVLVLVVLLIVGGLWLLFSGNTEAPEERIVRSSRLAVLGDMVALRATSSTSFATIASDTEVFPGAIVRTDETGRGLIEAPDGSITVVDTETELTIAAADAEQTALLLHTGNLWSRIEKSLERGEFYEIETQHAVAAVRGTQFGTLASDATTTVLVAEGVVGTILKDPITGARIPESATTTPAGHKITIATDGTMQIEPLSEEDRTHPWFLFNNPDSADIPPPDDDTPLPPPPPPESALPAVVLTLTRVNPPEVTLGEDDNVVLTGSGFTDVAEVLVGAENIPEFFVTQDSTLYFDARLLNDTGIFDVSVVDSAGARATLSDALTVLEPPPEEEPQPTEDTTNNRYY
jgi:hypothetical protein